MKFQWVTFEKVEGIATVTLNRPDRLNALIPPMRVEIRKAVEDVAEDDKVRALILTGAGRGFCAGADAVTVAEDTDMAKKIIQMPPLTLALAKQAIYKSDAAYDIEAQIAVETLRNKTLRETEDQKEAARSFVEKREPVYRGE